MTTLMKKFFLFFAAIVLTVGMAACGGDEPEINNGNPDMETPSQPGDSDDPENPDNPDNPDDPGTATGNYLVVWYSWSGNSESNARDLAELVNGELVEIVPSVPYPDYSATAQRYREELAAIESSGTYPAIETEVENLDDYDAVFLCYPLWGARMSTPAQGFLNKHRDKLAGKTLALVCSTASSGIGQTVTDARRICPEARLAEALQIYSSQTGQAHRLLSDWLEKIGITNCTSD